VCCDVLMTNVKHLAEGAAMIRKGVGGLGRLVTMLAPVLVTVAGQSCNMYLQ
jgi:hypothetical protein